MEELYRRSIELYESVIAKCDSIRDRLADSQIVAESEIRDVVDEIETVSSKIYLIEHRGELRTAATALDIELATSSGNCLRHDVGKVKDQGKVVYLRDLGLAA